MRYVLIGILLGTVISGGTVSAQDPPDAQCQTLANKFSEGPNGLAIQELERLRFCVNQALERREKSLKGELLKGTIIESQPPSRVEKPTNPSEAPDGGKK